MTLRTALSIAPLPIGKTGCIKLRLKNMMKRTPLSLAIDFSEENRVP
jgi:hypothetical protein